MADIVERLIAASRLPPELRGDLPGDARVLVTVRRLTENGMTPEQERAILEAEAEMEAEGVPFRPAAEVLAELRAIADAYP